MIKLDCLFIHNIYSKYLYKPSYKISKVNIVSRYINSSIAIFIVHYLEILILKKCSFFVVLFSFLLFLIIHISFCVIYNYILHLYIYIYDLLYVFFNQCGFEDVIFISMSYLKSLPTCSQSNQNQAIYQP